MNQTKNLSHRILKVFIALVVLIVLLSIIALQFPRPLTGLFFKVNVSGIEMPLNTSHASRPADSKTEEIVMTAHAFLNSLDEKQKQAIQYPFDDNFQRANWSNFPEGMVPRGGLKLGQLSVDQRNLLDNLLKVFMSEKGIQNLDLQLAAEETFPTNHLINKYGVDHFYTAFVGTPSETQPWMFQFGGHHLALNITVYGAHTSFSPMLTGGQPLHIEFKGKKVFITAEEIKSAHTFLDSLSTKQKQQAIRADLPIDLLLGPGEFGTQIIPEGLKGSELDADQKKLLLDLINERIGFFNTHDSREKMKVAEQELDETYFGWWGPQDKPGFAYYRITAPSLFLEYAPQDTDEAIDKLNHAHNIYRNPANDYGSAWISPKPE